MKKHFYANFKMNKTYKEIEDYCKNFIQTVKINDKNEIALFVPYVSLKETKHLFKNENILIGAQNVHFADNGAYTGEISAIMLKECETDVVLIGHSERRKFFKETDEDINKKIKQMMKYNVKVVLCIGETRDERQMLKTKQVITNQLKKALNGLYENEFKNIIIAYEPIWAIGTGEVATNKIIEEAINLIREILASLYNSALSNNTPILYGGSVTQENCKSLNKIKNLNGFLIGGASLNPKDFSFIINSCFQE